MCYAVKYIKTEKTMTEISNFFLCVIAWKDKKRDYVAKIVKYT